MNTEMTIGQITQIVCRELPEDWGLEIALERGAGDVRLYAPEGTVWTYDPSEERTLEECVIEALKHAKDRGGFGA